MQPVTDPSPREKVEFGIPPESRPDELAQPHIIDCVHVFLIAFVAAIGGFLFGYDLVVISGAQLYLKDQFHLNDAQFGFATTSAIFGCIAGPIIGMGLCDAIGRRRTMISSALLFVVGAIGTALPPTNWVQGSWNIGLTLFNAFRIVGGLGVGLCSIASPMYIAEIAPPRMRGGLGLMYKLAIVAGALSAALISWLLSGLPEIVSWRWMFASIIPPILFFVGLLLVSPSSPRWLSEKGRFDQARQVLKRIGGDAYADAELREIRESLAAETGSWAEVFSPGMRRALVVGILLAVFNNWTGWSAMGYYLPDLFQKAGFTNKSDAIFQSIYVQLWNLVLTLVAIYYVDRLGRRKLWQIGSLSMIFAMTLAWAVFQCDVKGWVVLVVIFICSAPQALSLGPLPWLMMSELYPTRIRARSVAVTTTVLWLAGWSGPMAFPILTSAAERKFGSVGPAFLVFAVISIFSFIFGRTLLPETKGRTLEEIADSWGRGNH